MIEVIEKRTVDSKTYSLGNNRFRLSKKIGGLVHYRDAEGNLQDINLTPVTKDGLPTVDRAPYVLKIDGNSYHYTSQAGEVSVELLSTDLTDTEYKITPLPFGVKTELILASDKAPKQWSWRILGNKQLIRPIIGVDAKRQRCDIETVVDGDIVTATWSGRVSTRLSQRLNPRNPWLEVAYPVNIDPTVNETIGASADDGFSRTGFGAAFSFVGNTNNYMGHRAIGTAIVWNDVPGVRFQTLAIPNAATINSAVLTFHINGVGDNPSLKFYADDVDDAAAFATTSRPVNITKTTAFATFAPTATGPQTVNVQSLVQEIVNRAGWASGQDMRFVGFPGTALGYASWEDLEAPGTGQADLDIDYTAGGGGVPWYKRNVRFTGGLNKMTTGGFDG